MDKKANMKNQVPALSNVTMETVMKSPPRVRSVSTTALSSSGDASSPINRKSKKKSTSLPVETVEYLKAWMMSPEHIAHPYPTEQEKRQIMDATGIELRQLTNWFVNNRKRYWKPRVEARLREQQQTSPKASFSPTVIKQDGSIQSLADTAPPAAATVQPTDEAPAPKRGAPKRRPSVELVPHGSPFLMGEQQATLVSASNSFSVVSSDDEDAAREEPMILKEKAEYIDIHILRPANRPVPELSDVTILQNIPTERILRTFEKCALKYSFTDGNEKSRRDAEIVRVKKHFLALYLAEEGCATRTPTTTKKKRKQVHVVPMTPRPKFRRVSVELWKEACQTAGHVYDEELPSLEEATQLFGYAL